MLIDIFALMLAMFKKVFLFIAIGYLLNIILKKNLNKAADIFADIAVYVLVPLFVFFSIWCSPIAFDGGIKIAVAALIVIAAGFAFAYAWTQRNKFEFKKAALPVIFMNSAYLAIPVNAMIFGQIGANYAIIYNLVVTLINFSFGIWVAEGRINLWGILKIPVLLAFAVGLAMKLLSIPFGQSGPVALKVLSAVTLPAMLVFVGMRLGYLKKATVALAFQGFGLRFSAGIAGAAAAIAFLGLEGIERDVCVMSSIMPSAVHSYLFAEKYHLEPEYSAACVFVGTVLSLAYIPIIGVVFG